MKFFINLNSIIKIRLLKKQNKNSNGTLIGMRVSIAKLNANKIMAASEEKKDTQNQDSQQSGQQGSGSQQSGQQGSTDSDKSKGEDENNDTQNAEDTGRTNEGDKGNKNPESNEQNTIKV